MRTPRSKCAPRAAAYQARPVTASPQQPLSIPTTGESTAPERHVGLHLAYSIATGQSHFLGCAINRHGTVVYLCAEGRGGLSRRRAAWRQAHGHTDSVPGIVFWRDPLDIRDAEQVAVLIDQIRSHYPDVVLVVIDTLSQHMPGGDEGTKDMSAALHSCQRIRDELGTTVSAVHHPSKGDDRNAGSMVAVPTSSTWKPRTGFSGSPPCTRGTVRPTPRSRMCSTW